MISKRLIETYILIKKVPVVSKKLNKIETIILSYNSCGRFVLSVKSGRKDIFNVGEISYMKIAKEIFDMKLKDAIRIKIKGIIKQQLISRIS